MLVTRGHRVGLVEREDFSSGTSSRSTKLTHGGVRYLEKAIFSLDYEQLKLVFHALAELKQVIENAPDLCLALPRMTPCFDWFEVVYYWMAYKNLLGKEFNSYAKVVKELTAARKVFDVMLHKSVGCYWTLYLGMCFARINLFAPSFLLLIYKESVLNMDQRNHAFPLRWINEDLGETKLLLVKENYCLDSHAPEPCINSLNSLQKQDVESADHSSFHDVEDYNEVLNQYYELEENRQKILEQHYQFGG